MPAPATGRPPWWQAPQPAWFQRALAAPVRTSTLRVNGCPIAYRHWGDSGRPAVVLLHGFLGHSRWWDFAAPWLLGQWQVLAPDFSGMGDSGRRADYAPRVHAREIIGFCDALGLDARTRIVGHSYGGFAGFIACSQAPGRFRQLVMVDAPIRGPDEPLPSRQDTFGATGSRVYPDYEQALGRFRIVPDQGCEHPFLLEHIARHSLRAVDGGWAWKFDPALLRLGLVGGLHEAFAACDGDVSVIHASHSRIFLPRHLALMQSLARRPLQCIEVPEAEHHLFLNQPMAFITALRAALGRFDDGARG